MEFQQSLYLFSLIQLVLLFGFLRKWFNQTSRKQSSSPPSPPKLPILGNLFQLGKYPHRSLQNLSKKYGPLVLLRFGCKDVLVASSAEAARDIMKTNDLVFSNRPKTRMPEKLLYGSKDVAFAPYGEYWRQIRSICVLQLLSNKKVQSFRGVREEETSLMINKINEQLCETSSSTINLSQLLVTLTNDVVSKVALGRKYSDGETGRKAIVMLKELMELMGVFDIGDYIPWLAWLNQLSGLDAKVKRVAKEIDEFLEGVIEEHIALAEDSCTTDFVDILLHLQKENMAGFALERDALKAVIMDMFVAGTDTSQTVMEWAMAELLKNPHTLENLQSEVRKVVDGKQEIVEDDLEKMQYLKAVIKEALRLHSPVPLLVARESTQDTKVMGYDIPKGTKVFINSWAIGRDPSLWTDPLDFKPERFLNSNIDYRGLDFPLIPFGAGRRGCPGIAFASAVIELALAKLVHKFNFALPDGLKPHDLDMAEANGITVHKKHPLRVIATPCSLI